MPPKKKSTTTKTPTSNNNNNSDDVPPPTQHQEQKPTESTAPPLMSMPQRQTAASVLFGNKKTTTTSNNSSKVTAAAASSFDSLKQQVSSLPAIDEIITTTTQSDNNNIIKNSFLQKISASTSKFSFEQTLELVQDFVQTTFTGLSANSFLFCLAILAEKKPSEEQMMRSLVSLIKSTSNDHPLQLRGSLFDASRQVLLVKDNSSSSLIISNIFKACLQVLIAAVEAGRHANVALLSSVVDGIACTCSSEIQPQSLLRDAAQLLTALGKFATVGAPRLRGLVSAWNAPVLPAKKEAMVVKGGPFKINVAPEFEVKHVTLKL